MKRRRASSGKRTPARGASGAVYPISLCMIVRNEERFLRDALTSVQGVVDEICIVDTGSTDGTVAIAQAFGARVECITWPEDFSAARNAALALATGAWIFVLDADERLAPESRPALRGLRSMPPDGEGRWIRCRNYSDPARKIVASTNLIVRIFPNDPAIRYRGALHEYAGRTGEERSLPASISPIEIVHHGYVPDVMSERGKRQRNLRLSQTALEAAPNDSALVYNYAMSALLAGDRELALAQLERVVTLTEHLQRGFRPMALTTLAGMYVELERPVDALATADRCVAVAPSLPDGHFARGCALAALGRHDEARAAFEGAIAAGASGAFIHFVVDDEISAWKAYNEIARSFLAENRFAEAEAWFERGVARSPGQRTLILNRGRCREAQGDLAGALAAFRSIFEEFRDEEAAIEYVNYVLRHDSPHHVMTAVEAALPMLGDDYRRGFLASAAAVMLRAQRRSDAAALVREALTVGNVPSAGYAVVKALAAHYAAPELAVLLDECAAPLVTVVPGPERHAR
jgi:glycosyltransferase involved in cell wall biosynthesis